MIPFGHIYIYIYSYSNTCIYKIIMDLTLTFPYFLAGCWSLFGDKVMSCRSVRSTGIFVHTSTSCTEVFCQKIIFMDAGLYVFSVI